MPLSDYVLVETQTLKSKMRTQAIVLYVTQ
jgi:hypothetical protein